MNEKVTFKGIIRSEFREGTLVVRAIEDLKDKNIANYGIFRKLLRSDDFDALDIITLVKGNEKQDPNNRILLCMILLELFFELTYFYNLYGLNPNMKKLLNIVDDICKDIGGLTAITINVEEESHELYNAATTALYTYFKREGLIVLTNDKPRQKKTNRSGLTNVQESLTKKVLTIKELDDLFNEVQEEKKEEKKEEKTPKEQMRIETKISNTHKSIIQKIIQRNLIIADITSPLGELVQNVLSGKEPQDRSKEFEVFYMVAKNAFKQFRRSPYSYAREYNEKFPFVMLYNHDGGYCIKKGKYQVAHDYLLNVHKIEHKPSEPYKVNKTNPIHVEIFRMVIEEYNRLTAKKVENPRLLPHIQALIYSNYVVLCIFHLECPLKPIQKFNTLDSKIKHNKSLVNKDLNHFDVQYLIQQHLNFIMGCSNSILDDEYDDLDDIILANQPKEKKKQTLEVPIDMLVDTTKFDIDENDSIQEEETMDTVMEEVTIDKVIVEETLPIRKYSDPFRYDQLVIEELLDVVIMYALVMDYQDLLKRKQDISTIQNILSSTNTGFDINQPVLWIDDLVGRYSTVFPPAVEDNRIPELMFLPEPKSVEKFAQNTKEQQYYVQEFKL